MTEEPDFKGYIHDVGGPTGEFPAARPVKKQLTHGVCPNRQCLFPKPCPNLKADHQDYVALLRKLRTLPGVKKVFIRSGIRFDYVMADPDDTFSAGAVRVSCQRPAEGGAGACVRPGPVAGWESRKVRSTRDLRIAIRR